MFAGSVNDEILRHFGGRPVDASEFTYVHYIDAHGPWEGAPFSADYESAIRYVDARIAELWTFFRRRYDGDLLFLVTSDHGQALGDDVAVGSGPKLREMKQSLHDFNLRIPFVVLGDPARVASGRRVSFPCTNLDVVPTLLEFAGLRPSLSLPGVSLQPWISPGRPPSSPERALYFAVSAFGSCSDALLWRGKKYLRFRDCASGDVTVRQVFDPEADPRETRELDVPFDEAEARMDRAAAGDGIRFEPTLEPLSDELAEKLRALGYVE
jgi:arylsulfatase A-like enzyme